MRNTARRTFGCLVLFALACASAGSLACTGGAGSSENTIAGWESTASSNERAANSREPGRPFGERASQTNEAPPRTEGAAGSTSGAAPGSSSGGEESRLPDLDCSGTYKCVKTGDDKQEDYPVQTVGGLCIVNGMIVDRDGKLYSLEDGTVVGSWSGKSPVTINTNNETRICSKG